MPNSDLAADPVVRARYPVLSRALLAGGLGLAFLWAGAATYGLVFRDDALARLENVVAGAS